MLYYDEVFLSIQGESRDSGIPTVFVRLYGCPIKCIYCDQPQEPRNRKKVSLKRLVSLVKESAYPNVKNVCITGGEPLIQEDCLPFVYELMYHGFNVSIETSGCVPIEPDPYRRSFRYVMDIKCPSSGVSHRNVFDNLINLHEKDEVKFVIKNKKDYDFMRQVLMKYPTSASILVSPMFLDDGTQTIGADLVKWILEDHINARVQIQLHKVLGVK